MNILEQFIKEAPKAELHVHLEGTLEPEMAMRLAQRNGIKLEVTLNELRQLYVFEDLQEFLNLYHKLVFVLVTEEDFFDLTCAYLGRAAHNGVCHVELFFDAQGHLRRGIALATIIAGINRAFEWAKTKGISGHLLMGFLRELSEAEAEQTFEEVLKFKHVIIGVGLSSAEKNNPPKKFTNVFKKAREHGFLTVAHAGEEGPVEYIWQALDELRVSRIDHGNACVHDPALIKRLVRDRIPLTMCPLSNLNLKVIPSLAHHPAKILLSHGVCVTINSDDPAYFGGYINDNLLAITDALNLKPSEVYTLLQNSFHASFLSDIQKNSYLEKLKEHARGYPELFTPSNY